MVWRQQASTHFLNWFFFNQCGLLNGELYTLLISNSLCVILKLPSQNFPKLSRFQWVNDKLTPNHMIRLTIMSKIPLLVPCRHCKDTIVNPETKIDDFGAWVDYSVVTVRKSGVQCIMFMYCRIDNRTKYELKNKFLALQLFSWVNVRNSEPSIH